MFKLKGLMFLLYKRHSLHTFHCHYFGNTIPQSFPNIVKVDVLWTQRITKHLYLLLVVIGNQFFFKLQPF